MSVNYSEDTRHIALSTINNVDILESWNFKHIVNVARIHGYNAVNLKEGYHILEIRSPRDILEGNQMKNKKFDSVKMIEDIREEIYQETKNLSGKEFIEKLKKEFPELHKKQKTAV